MKAGFGVRIAQKPTVQPMMKFSQLICGSESCLEPKFKQKICKTDFNLLFYSHFLSLPIIDLSYRFLLYFACLSLGTQSFILAIC